MSAVRTLLRSTLQRGYLPLSQSSTRCIRNASTICTRCSRVQTTTPQHRILLPSQHVIRGSRAHRHQRGYTTTIIHNQKYNEDNMPLTLEITPNCAKVSLLEIQSNFSNSRKFRLVRIIRI